jgi:hypothetical protein
LCSAFLNVAPGIGQGDAKDELKHVKNMTDAAFDAGVTHIVYGRLENVCALSNGKWDVPHFSIKAEAADYILSKGFKYVSFPEPGTYNQNFEDNFAPKPHVRWVLRAVLGSQLRV